MTADKQKGRKLRALLIDDDDIFRGFMDTLLADEGFEVEQARNGQEGMDLFHQSEYDLVITDIIMPGKEGLETIREIRQVAEDVPIIAVSGYTGTPSDDYLNHAKVFGASLTFRKPFHPEEFMEEVKKLVPALS